MKYFVIAGEASGDLHGSHLVKAIQQKDASATIVGWGGDLMQAQQVTILKHIQELAIMGFVEVVKKLRTVFKNISLVKQQIETHKPDIIIFIDYPGFNLRIAHWAKQLGYKTVYYISPQIWAWKENRVHKIKACIDEMICILPFEKDFYTKYNYPVHYIGHPLANIIHTFKAESTIEKKNEKKIIALLPGSRKQEVLSKLPIMLSVVKYFPEYQFIIAQSPTLDASFYKALIGNNNIDLIQNKTYTLLQQSHAAVVTSGTATLETALFKVPQVVCYKGNAISYAIGKRLIKVKYIALANLILNKLVVKELIQKELTEQNLKTSIDAILQESNRATIIAAYNTLEKLIYNPNALQEAADIIIQCGRK